MRYKRDMIAGLTGFIVGFIAGMIVNAYLLRGVSRETYINNKDMRLKYGALNWGIALFGMVIALAVRSGQ